MAVYSLVSTSQIETSHRWDAEAFLPILIKIDEAFKDSPSLFQLATVTHPSEILRVYSEDKNSKPFLRAQNIKPTLPSFDNLVFIPPETYNSIPLNLLETNDVLVTRSGAYSGVACVYLGNTGDVYTSGEGLILVPSKFVWRKIEVLQVSGGQGHGQAEATRHCRRQDHLPADSG